MLRTGFCCSVLLLLVSSCTKPQATTTPTGSPQANQIAPAARAQTERAKSDVESLQFALTTFKEDIGRYPNSSEGLNALFYKPSDVKNWHGPYIAHPAGNDPWGNAYVYVYPGVQNRATFDLYSRGPDGKDANGNAVNNWSAHN